MKVKIAALVVTPVFCLSSQTFAQEPVGLTPDEMDSVTAAADTVVIIVQDNPVRVGPVSVLTLEAQHSQQTDATITDDSVSAAHASQTQVRSK